MNGDEDRQRLAEYVTAARRAHYGTVEQAMRAAGLNRATWLRVEAGQAVRDDSLVAVERALGWDPNEAWRIMAGNEPGDAHAQPSAPSGSADELRERIEQAPMPDATRRAMLALLDGLLALLDSFRAATESTRKGA